MVGDSRLIVVSCRGGCGKQVTTLRRSLHGLDNLHSAYAGYCETCLPISQDELLEMQGRAIADRLTAGRQFHE